MRTLAAFAVVTLVVSGCGALEPSPPQPAPALPQIEPTAQVAFPRSLQADRLVEVRIASAGGDGLVVATDLATPYFEGPMGVERTVRVTPGFPARVRVPLGKAVCPAPAGTSAASYEVTAARGDGGGQPGAASARGTVTVDDAVLAEINAVECRQQLALDVAAPSFAAGPPPARGRLETHVLLTRGDSDAAASLVQLTGNVVFSLAPAVGALPAALDEDQPAPIPVTITASRCDAHAFAESKKTFVFVAIYELDGERIAVEYQAEGQVREALQALFDACGEASDADGIGGQ